MKIKINFNLDIAALFIAILAVLMAFWEGYESRVHNRKSVVPILNINDAKIYGDNANSYAITLKSVGLGPANITRFKVFFNQREEQLFTQPGFETAFISARSAAQGIVDDANDSAGSNHYLDVSDETLDDETYISADEERLLLAFESDLDADTFRTLISTIENTLDIFVCYCSVYDDQCRRTHFGNNPNLTNQQCRIPLLKPKSNE